ncbi:MAG TPA: hypothetical protein DCP61_02015 [Treponema sp.]|nr:hypothetical protein [Treponema sp.]
MLLFFFWTILFLLTRFAGFRLSPPFSAGISKSCMANGRCGFHKKQKPLLPPRTLRALPIGGRICLLYQIVSFDVMPNLDSESSSE